MKTKEPRTAIGYYRMRDSHKKRIKLLAKKHRISEAAALEMILTVYFAG